jgi:hypothetical protein
MTITRTPNSFLAIFRKYTGSNSSKLFYCTFEDNKCNVGTDVFHNTSTRDVSNGLNKINLILEQKYPLQTLFLQVTLEGELFGFKIIKVRSG